MSYMNSEINSRTAKNQFGQLLVVPSVPGSTVTRRGRAAGVLLSEEQYQRLRGTISYGQYHGGA